MWRKSMFAGMLVTMVTFSGLASAQVAVQRQLGSTSKLVVKLVTGQVVEVNKAGGTFKVAVGKQAYVFTYAKLGKAPRFGDEHSYYKNDERRHDGNIYVKRDEVNVTYAENSGGPADALKLTSID